MSRNSGIASGQNKSHSSKNNSISNNNLMVFANLEEENNKLKKEIEEI